MIDEFDYREPPCPLSGGKEFYDPQKGAPLGRIPIDRIIAKLDGLFDKNDYTEAGRLLRYWRDEAVTLRDGRGELAMESELIGYYRKQNDPEQGLASVARAQVLVEELNQGEMASGATVFINCATAYHAFGKKEEALPLYRRAEAVYQRVLPKGDARLGGLYNNMALTLGDMDLFEEAEAAYFAALDIMEKIPQGEAESAITYLNLAHLYERSEKAEQIGDCLKKACTLLQSEDLPHNGYYAFVLEKCAPSFAYFGDIATAEKMKKESEEIYARA